MDYLVSGMEGKESYSCSENSTFYNQTLSLMYQIMLQCYKPK